MTDLKLGARQLSLFAEDLIQRRVGPRTFIADSVPEFGTLVSRMFYAVVDSFSVWNRRRVIETEMSALSAHMLEDIGVERDMIQGVARQWAVTEVERIQAERRDVRASKAAEKSDVPAYTPATEAHETPAVVANDDRHSIAA